MTCPGLSETDGESCQEAECCVTKIVWKRINDSISAAVDTFMLEDLIDESRRIHEMHTKNDITERKISCSS